MATVRQDVVGEVWADMAGAPVVLRAGDDVPAGVQVGEELLEPSKPTRPKSAK